MSCLSPVSPSLPKWGGTLAGIASKPLRKQPFHAPFDPHVRLQPLPTRDHSPTSILCPLKAPQPTGGMSLKLKLKKKNGSHTDRWDDWVPQERLRKNTDENRELATNLRKEMEALSKRHQKAPPASHKKRTDRASEDTQSIVAGSRGQKRGRDFEIDRVRIFLLSSFLCC